MTATGPSHASTGDPSPAGASTIRGAVAGTILFAALSVAAVVAPDTVGPVAAAVDLGLFVVGCAAFVWAFLVAVGRSRTEAISVTSIYLLSGSAPPPVRRVLLGSLAAQVVIGLGAASLRPFSALAFGILVPVFGLGACGLWAARHGSFPRRDEV